MSPYFALIHETVLGKATWQSGILYNVYFVVYFQYLMHALISNPITNDASRSNKIAYGAAITLGISWILFRIVFPAIGLYQLAGDLVPAGF